MFFCGFWIIFNNLIIQHIPRYVLNFQQFNQSMVGAIIIQTVPTHNEITIVYKNSLIIVLDF
jgi:hypothetical protein